MELFMLLDKQDVWEKLERVSQERIDSLWNTHRAAIRNLRSSEHEKYDKIREIAKEPESIEFKAPFEITINQQSDEKFYEKHLYTKDDGTYSTKLNSWEDAAIIAEIEKDDVVAWLRNYQYKSLCLSVLVVTLINHEADNFNTILSS